QPGARVLVLVLVHLRDALAEDLVDRDLAGDQAITDGFFFLAAAVQQNTSQQNDQPASLKHEPPPPLPIFLGRPQRARPLRKRWNRRRRPIRRRGATPRRWRV